MYKWTAMRSHMPYMVPLNDRFMTAQQNNSKIDNALYQAESAVDEVQNIAKKTDEMSRVELLLSGLVGVTIISLIFVMSKI